MTVRDFVGLDDLEPGAPVIVACSGGADSLALLALACERGYAVHAIYVDHGLRATTAHDAEVVACAARRFGASHEVVSVTFDANANLEARARDARYAALERVRAGRDADAIFVGHTRDDQAETVLLNLLRGSGTAGIAGMAVRRGFIRRPLLDTRRAETQELCARLGLAPVADPMNADVHHRRVWLRREIIPALERGVDRDLVDVLARQADLVRDDNALLDALAADVDPSDGAALSKQPAPLARRALRRWLGSPPPSAATIERVLAVGRGERRAAELPGGGRVERAGGRLVRIAPDDAAPLPPSHLLLPGRAHYGALAFEAWVESAPPAAWPDGRRVAVCDADAVGDAATIRPAEPGERFRPLGRGGSKLVADALAEAGVPAGRRSQSPIVAASSPIWVVGYRIDHRVRVTSRTQRFLWMSAEPA